jgi:hypothetical protein
MLTGLDIGQHRIGARLLDLDALLVLGTLQGELLVDLQKFDLARMGAGVADLLDEFRG